MEYLRDHRCERTDMAYINICACQLNTSWALVFCIYTAVCTLSKDMFINKENKIWLPNKESMWS